MAKSLDKVRYGIMLASRLREELSSVEGDALPAKSTPHNEVMQSLASWEAWGTA